MATSLQHISEKMMKMDVDKFGVQSLGLNLIPAVPDKFLIKYDPPKIWVVYHFKDHNEKDQYWRDIPLEVSSDSTAQGVADHLFKEHSYYFDKELIASKQVEKLIQMIIERNFAAQRKQNMSQNKQEAPKVEPIIQKEKPKSHNRLFDDIEKARDLEKSNEFEFPEVSAKKKLEPITSSTKPESSKQKEKVELAKPKDEFDLLGFDDDFMDDKEEKPVEKAQEKEESDDFDFDFVDAPPSGDSKKSPAVVIENTDEDSKYNKEGAKEWMNDFLGREKPNTEDKKKEIKEDKPFDKETIRKKEPEKEVSEASASKENEDEYIVIDGKRFREIQIEGEQDEFLMDDDGNIYDKEGVYIGTAKDGAEEEEEEAEK